MQTFTYKKMPNISQLWDDCSKELIYNLKQYAEDLEKILQEKGINKSSKIIDSSAGSGFPAIELARRGYKMECMDISQDAIDVFGVRAREANVNISCRKLSWLEMPQVYKKNSFDFLFCRGNSFIYASGGWGSNADLTRKHALQNYENTLRVFYNCMKEGAWMYLDKFKDNEGNCKELVGKVKVGKEIYNWFLSRNILPNQHIREAKMIFEQNGLITPIVEFKTYLLTFDELIPMMQRVGFRNIEKLQLNSENHFDILLAQK